MDLEVSIDIDVQEPLWNSVKDLEDLTEQTVLKTLMHATLPEYISNKTLEISVVYANDDVVQVLNNQYRGINKPTNVLSFAMLDALEKTDAPAVALGDLIMAFETITKEADEVDKFIRDHIAHLIVHGTLHLLGYDHIEDDDANVMETLEIRILQGMNIQNPYTETL